MKRSILITLLSLTLGAGAVSAESFVVRQAPPAPRDYALHAQAGYVWVHGNWQWNGYQWVWMEGRYEPERADQVWVDGAWIQYGPSWRWRPGRWAPRRADAAWIPGRWQRVGGRPPVWSDGRWDRRPVAHHHRDRGDQRFERPNPRDDRRDERFERRGDRDDRRDQRRDHRGRGRR